ncbi:MAG: AAA family ATPase [Candidatus Pacearchaeota archaeon]
MIIKKIYLRNIRSYKEAEVVFPEGSVLLAGDIGSGKTSILMAIQFALFGLQPGQKGSSLVKSGEEEAEVSLIFLLDKKEIKITRKIIKTKNSSFSQEENLISIDGEEFSLSSTEMKSKLISLMGYPKEFSKKSDLLFKFSVYTPQEEMKEIIREKEETRLSVLRHIFGIERYKRIKENCAFLKQKIKESIKIKEALSENLNELKEELKKQTERKVVLSREINDLSICVSRLKEEKDLLKKNLDELKLKKEEQRHLEIKLSSKESELKVKKELKLKAEKEISLLNLKLSQKTSEFDPSSLENVRILIEKHKAIINELLDNKTKISSKIEVLREKKERSFSLIERISKLENCPTCFQRVSEEHKEKIKKNESYEIESLNKELEQKIFEKKQIEKDLEKEKELLSSYENDKLRLEKEKINFEHYKEIETKLKSEIFVLERVSNEIAVLSREIDEIKKKLMDYVSISKTFEEKEKEFFSLEDEERRKEKSYVAYKKELELLEKEIEKISTDISKKENLRKEAINLREFSCWIDEEFIPLIEKTEAIILSRIRSDFSKIFSDWFSSLVPEYLKAELNENFTPIIKNQGYEIDYEFLSGGEKTAIALAYRLALNQILNSVHSEIKTKDLLILDEPTDGFSEKQIERIRAVLEQLNTKQIILVSHEPQIEGFVDNIIKVVKDENSMIICNQ